MTDCLMTSRVAVITLTARALGRVRKRTGDTEGASAARQPHAAASRGKYCLWHPRQMRCAQSGCTTTRQAPVETAPPPQTGSLRPAARRAAHCSVGGAAGAAPETAALRRMLRSADTLAGERPLLG